MHRKGAQDKKRAKVFTKLIRELTVAAQAGADPSANPRLRAAIAAARVANMPKDTLERAIKRGSGGEDGANYQEMRYEGYGPSGVAIIVETLTDNKNRTAPEVRSTFGKYGGNLGEQNSVSFQFERLGAISYEDISHTFEKVFEAALEAGADDVENNEGSIEIYCSPDNLHTVRDALSKDLGDPTSAKLIWRPKVTVPVDEKSAETLLKLIDTLEDNDDVQSVYANFDIDPAVLEKLNLN